MEGDRTTRSLPQSLQVLIVTVLTAGIGLTIGGVLVGGQIIGHSEAAAAQPPGAPTPGVFKPTKDQWAGIKVSTVETMTFRTEEVTDGKIAINDDRTTPVFSPYSGRVTRLIAKLGDVVQRGAPLLDVAASEFVQGQNDLITAAAALNKARSQLHLTEISEKRQHDLYEAKAGALKDWQQAQADLAGARNDVRSAEIALNAVRNRLRILGKSDAAITALENAQAMNAESVVVAPIAGTVIQRKVGLGQYIQSGASDPVYSIGDLTTVWLIGNVREQEAPRMRVGQPVEVRVLAYPGRVFKAKIAYVAASVDPNTRRLPVRAEVENEDQALKPEMFASFSIITGDEAAAPAVPVEGIVYEGETARVWVVGDDGSVALRPVRIGRIMAGMVEILDGLKQGEKIVTGGTLFIDRAAQTD